MVTYENIWLGPSGHNDKEYFGSLSDADKSARQAIWERGGKIQMFECITHSRLLIREYRYINGQGVISREIFNASY